MQTLSNCYPDNLLLKDVGTQWQWLTSAIDLHREPGFPVIVDDASEKTLHIIEDVTHLYAELGTGR